MKILFITPSYKPAYVYGGPTVSVSELAEALVQAGASVTVYTTTANGKVELDVPTTRPVDCNGVTVYYFKRLTGDHTHVSPALWRRLFATVRHYDVVHIQSWWSVLVIGAAAICRFKGRRFVLSPRGMLSRYTFDTLHTRPKHWLHKIVGAKLLRHSWLHATSDLEWRDCRGVIKGWQGFVLPNLVRFPTNVAVKQVVEKNGPLTFGFLSRIDPKKGLEELFQALATVEFPFQLRIAGAGEEHYISQLKTLANRFRISANIEWCGWQQGDQKFDFLRSVDVFALVSHNENFANVVVEALSVGTAVLVSEGVGLCDYVAANRLGWVCTNTPSNLMETLTTIQSLRKQLAEISERAPATVRNDFNHQRLAVAYLQAYNRLPGVSRVSAEPTAPIPAA